MIIRVSYPIEGVSGRFVLTSDPAGHWAVRVADIWEK
jgi:hypothetical protein